MAANAGFIVGWTKAFPGREALTVAKFPEYVAWLSKLQAESVIESFEPVLLTPHGGDLNGFFIVRGEAAKLDQLQRTEAWREWTAWGAFHLQGFGVIQAHLGDAVPAEMARFGRLAQT